MRKGDTPGGGAPLLTSRLAHHAFGQVLAEHALIIFSDQRPLRLVALVEEADPEGVADVAKNMRVLRPADHRTRAHDGRDIAVDKSLPRELRYLDHLVDDGLA